MRDHRERVRAHVVLFRERDLSARIVRERRGLVKRLYETIATRVKAYVVTLKDFVATVAPVTVWLLSIVTAAMHDKRS